MKKKTSPKVLIVDIETAPILAEVWDIWDQNVGLNQIVKDWSILSWSASWLDENKIHYRDTGNQKDVRDDSKILLPLWKLLDQAEIVVGQNSVRFDVPKIRARFAYNNIKDRKPPSDFRQQDTMRMAKKYFSLTSFKLEYMAKFFGLKTQKMVHRKFVGHELWRECLKGNKKAWAEMRKYNPVDVKATKELYKVLLPYDKSINFNVYNPHAENKCSCGSFVIQKRGFAYTNAGKFQQYWCYDCGKWWTDTKNNLLSKLKRKGMFK
jgi:hypothetical protein